MGLKLHWGEPKRPSEVRTWFGASSHKLKGAQQPWSHRFLTHEVKRRYGVSFGRSWFFGLSMLGETKTYDTQDGPRVGCCANRES